jgi:hypothetical protein
MRLTLHKDGYLASRTGPIPPGEEVLPTYWVGVWVGLRDSERFGEQKKFSSAGNRTTVHRSYSLWSSHYTDYAVSTHAHNEKSFVSKFRFAVDDFKSILDEQCDKSWGSTVT